MTAGGGWEKVLQVWWARRARATGNVAALWALRSLGRGPRAEGRGPRARGCPRLIRPRRRLDLARGEPAVGTTRC